jgi:hypothetical protein
MPAAGLRGCRSDIHVERDQCRQTVGARGRLSRPSHRTSRSAPDLGTLMTLADIAGRGDLPEGHRLWPHIRGWASRLGLTGPDAIARASKPPSEINTDQERAGRQPDREAAD